MNEQVEGRRAFIINFLYVFTIVAIIYLVLEYLLPWILPFIIGYCIALILKPIVFRCVRLTRLNHRLVSLIVLLLAYALFATLLTFGGVRLFSFLKTLFSNLPAFYEYTFRPAILEADAFLRRLIGNILPELAGGTNELLSEALNTLQNSLFSLSSYALGGLASIAGRLPQFFLTFLFSIMSSVLISMNYREVASFLAKQVPKRHRQLLFAIKDTATGTVLKYIKAYLILMCITFAELSAGLLLLHVDNAVPIALGIAVFDVLPVLGTGGIMIPWAIISLLQTNLPRAFGLAVLYGIVALVRNIIEPKVVGSTLGLHPLITLMSIYIGFQWKGVLGMILIPIIVQITAGLHKRGFIHLWNN